MPSFLVFAVTVASAILGMSVNDATALKEEDKWIPATHFTDDIKIILPGRTAAVIRRVDFGLNPVVKAKWDAIARLSRVQVLTNTIDDTTLELTDVREIANAQAIAPSAFIFYSNY